MRPVRNSSHRARAPDMPGWMPIFSNSVAWKPICSRLGMLAVGQGASPPVQGHSAVSTAVRRFSQAFLYGVKTKNGLILGRLEGNAAGEQAVGHRCIALLGCRLVVAIGVNDVHVQLAGQGRN